MGEKKRGEEGKQEKRERKRMGMKEEGWKGGKQGRGFRFINLPQ